NLELVSRLYAAWRERGFGVVPELMDPDIEYANPPYAVEPGTRRGYDEFAEAARALNAVFGAYEVTVIDAHDLGDRVVVRASVTTRSNANAVPIATERGYVFHVRDGLVTRFAWFNSADEALASATASG